MTATGTSWVQVRSPLIGVVMPNRRAMPATVPKPTSLPSEAATVFFE